MSLAMDNAVMTLSLDEEDMLFAMPDLLEFSLAEENKTSLMGRILNPRCQKMSSLIMKCLENSRKKVGYEGLLCLRSVFSSSLSMNMSCWMFLKEGFKLMKKGLLCWKDVLKTHPKIYSTFYFGFK